MPTVGNAYGSGGSSTVTNWFAAAQQRPPAGQVSRTFSARPDWNGADTWLNTDPWPGPHSAILAATATVTITATIGATAAVVRPTTATVSGVATITAAAIIVKQVAATVTSTATVTAAAALTRPATATVSGTATVTSAAVTIRPVTATASGIATITATATVRRSTTASVTATATITATAAVLVDAAVHIFRVPIRESGVRLGAMSRGSERALFRHFSTGGVAPAVLIEGGVVSEVVSPTVDRVNAADYAYMGGHENVVSSAERTLLEAAGYVVT